MPKPPRENPGQMSARLTCWAFAALAVFFWTAGRADAQGWREDRSRTEGIGVRVGDLELHPGIRAEAGYDSNVYLADSDSRGSAVFRVTPEFSVSTLGPQRSDNGEGAPPTLEFDLGTSVPVYYFVDVPQRTLVEANADLGFRLLPKRPVSLEFDGRYSRSARPFTEGGLRARYGRNTLDAAPRLRFQTSGGVLKASVGGRYSYTFFEKSDFAPYDTMTYAATVDAAWEFLPKTALVYEGELAVRNFDRSASPPSATGLRNDGTRWQFRVGLNGALSARLSATAMVGYTASFFDGGADKDSPTLAVQLRWRPSDTVTASLGYDRTLNSAYQGNFQTSDRVNAKLDLLMVGAFLMTIEGNYTHLQFGTDANLDGTQRARADHRIGGQLSAEYRFTDWFALTGNVAATKVFTDYEYQSTTPMMATVVDPVRYGKVDAFVGLRIFY